MKRLQEMLALVEEGLLSEKVHKVPPGTFAGHPDDPVFKRGSPEPWERARAFDKVNPKTGARPDRSFLKGYHGGGANGKGKYFGLEYADEGDFISVIVMRDDVEPTYGSKKKDPNDEYNGINVLFFPDGKIDADTYDVQSKRQWMKDKDKIIAAAKAALKDKDLPGQYDGLGGKEVKRGTGKLSFDTDNHVLRGDEKKSKHNSDYHGYHDKKVNEAKWSAAVDTDWTPSEGFFKKSAQSIASGLKRASKDLKQAMSRLNFYVNRAGKNLSAEDKSKLQHAKQLLSGLYEGLKLKTSGEFEEKPMFGLENAKNARKAKEALKAVNATFTSDSNFGVTYFYFDTKKAMKDALKVVKTVIDASLESEW